MNREQLDAKHTAAIRRHWRTLVDTGGVPPDALLDDLAVIATHHADPGEKTTGAQAPAPPAPAPPAPAPAPPAPAPRPPAKAATRPVPARHPASTRARRTST